MIHKDAKNCKKSAQFEITLSYFNLLHKAIYNKFDFMKILSI